MNAASIYASRFVRLVFFWIAVLLTMPVLAATDPMEGIDPKIAKICASVANLDAPLKDQPTKDEAAKLDCTKDYYYGIGTAVDYTLARKCGFIEADKGADTVFSGNSILMMIYANGLEVPKNINLALHFACEDHDVAAQAEYEGRIAHLDELRKLKAGQKMAACTKDSGLSDDYCKGAFDYCDDITSGMMSGVCSSRESTLQEVKKAAEFAKITSGWSDADRQAFAPLEKAANAYIDAHSQNEIDLSGTARGMFVVDERDTSKAHFRETIRKYDAGSLPVFTAADFDTADKELNRVYVQVMKAAESTENMSTVHKDEVRTTQKVWLTYRDAWVRFAAQHYPSATPDAVKTWATYERVRELKAVLNLTK